jgi:hypothetical protein
MVGITVGTTNGYSIDEFQIFGTLSVGCPAPANLNASTGAVTTIFTTQTPSGNVGQDIHPLELGVKFRSNVAGYVTGVRFFKALNSVNGQDIGELYSYPGGVRLAQATFSESAYGWQNVTFSAPVLVAANTTYVAAYYNPTANYAADNNGFATAISNGSLTGLMDGTDGNNGVYNYDLNNSGPLYPNQSFQASNYWVDVLFSPLDPSTEYITWDANPAAASYNIQYRPSLSQSWINRSSSTNSLNLSALSCGTEYLFSVQSNCGATQSTISQGSFSSADCGTSTCDPLPTRYFSLDLGDIGVAGSTCRNGTVYTLSGSGDIHGIADAFQYAYTSNDVADYDVSGKIVQQDGVSTSNKIGIMVRDSITNTSRFAFVGSVNNGTNFIFEFRSTAGGPVGTITVPGHNLPYWVKISKSGTMYAAFISPDNINWTQAGATVNLNFGTDVTNVPHYGMAVASGNNSILSTGKIDGFTITASTPLPIRLLSFAAKNINDDNVLITWVTSMEHLVDHFEVQRSADNTHFDAIGIRKAVGESEINQYYSLTDNSPVMGDNYYRLKEFDKDGNFYLSPVVSVDMPASGVLEIYPNPADDYTHIISRKNPILEVKLYNVTGKLLRELYPGTSQMTVQLNTADLPKGIYIISVKTNSAVYRQKLFKQ